MNISKQKDSSLMKKQFSELYLNTNSQENSWNDLDAEQAICTKAVRNKSNKCKSLTQSKKKSPVAMRKEIELQIMDRGNVSIEKVAEQFLVERSEIENRDSHYTADDYIPTLKSISADFLHSFDQNDTMIIMRRK